MHSALAAPRHQPRSLQNPFYPAVAESDRPRCPVSREAPVREHFRVTDSQKNSNEAYESTATGYDYTRLSVSTSREKRNVHKQAEADIGLPVTPLSEDALLIPRDLVARIINGLSLCAHKRPKGRAFLHVPARLVQTLTDAAIHHSVRHGSKRDI